MARRAVPSRPRTSARLWLIAIVALLPLPARAFIPDGYQGTVVHVTFDGSGTYVRDDTGPTYHADATVMWHAEYDIPVPDVASGLVRVNSSPFESGTTVTGTSSVNAPAQSISCTNQPIVVHPPSNAAHETPFIGAWGGLGNTSALPTITLYVDAMGGYDYVPCGGGGIGVGPFVPAGGGLTWTFDVLIAKFDFDLAEWVNQPPHLKNLPVMKSEMASTDTETASVDWSGQITLQSRKVGSGPPPPSVADVKADALRSFVNDEFPAAIFCLADALGGVLAGSDDPSDVVAGSWIMEAADPVCIDILFEMYDLARTYDDPPSADYRHILPVVRTPAPAVASSVCTSLDASKRALCRRVFKATGTYLRKVHKGRDVATALSGTMDRYSGAVNAGETKAAARQARAAKKRIAQVKAAIAARGRAGAKLASALQAMGIGGHVTETQFGTATTNLLTKLAAQGLSQQEATTLLGDGLTPRELDPFAVLGQ